MIKYTQKDLHYKLDIPEELEEVLDFLNDPAEDNVSLKHELLLDPPEIIESRNIRLIQDQYRRAIIGQVG